ncbi:MFS transporter [Rhodoferax koreense]|uniref:MFS transporter n=1 Tax=Rhodoferax koreensis TaxID=1842727 RepID=A0A1P8JWA5_9BURK|nr:MFS transporter [Rhodoferax koreense]APW37961.1 MFS transporter [Rhodoferax koreense]
MRGPSTLPTSLIALSWLAFFMADVRDGLGPFLATYLQENKVPQAWIGYTMTAGGLAAVAMTPLAGAWVDRASAKRAMTAVSAVAIMGASALAFTTLAGPLLMASQIVTGVAGALLAAAMAALTLGLARSAGFKRQTGRNEAFSHAGNMVSAIGAGLAAHWFGAPWMLAVMGAMACGALLSILAIRPADIDHEAARGNEPQDAPPAVVDAEGHAPVRALFRNRPLLLFALACAFFHLGNAAMLPLLNQRLAATVAGSAPLLWTGIAIVVAQLTMIPVALWVSRSRRFDVAWFFYAAILVLPLRGALAYAFTSEWNNIPVQVLDGLAAGALGVATPLLVQRYTRGSGRFNTALGLVMTLQGIGAAISPGAANLIVGDGQHFGIAFVALAAAALLAGPVFWLAQRDFGKAPRPREAFA